MKKEQKNKFDLMDAVTCTGLFLLITGIWDISPAWAMIIGGSLIFLIGLMGSRS